MWQWLRSHPLVLVLFITLIVYLPYFSVRFVWDDEQFIFSNQYILAGDVASILSNSVTNGAGIASNYFRPLTSLSFAIDHAIWGLNPTAFRFVNIAAHLLAGGVIYLLLKRLKASRLTATSIAGLFLLHPIQVEAVTYINARSNSFFTLFGMLGVLCFTLAIQVRLKQFNFWGVEYTISRPQFLLLSLLFYAMAVFSKETALAVIGLFFSIFAVQCFTFIKESTTKQIWQQRFIDYIRTQWQATAALLFGLLLAFLYLYLRTTVWNFNDTFNQAGFEDIYAQSLYVRLHTFTKVFFLYQQKLTVPYPLHMEYLVEPLTTWISGWLIAFVAVITSWIFFGWKALQRGNFWLLLGLMWYFVPLVPVSGIIPVNGIMYESWQYVPIIGWGMSLYGLYRFLHGHVLLRQYPRILIGVGLLIVVLYTTLAIRQNYYWSTPIRLYTYLLRYTESARIHNNLGMAYAEADRLEEALREYNRALELGYNYPQIHHNMATSYTTLGEYDKAIDSYKKALELNSQFYYSYGGLLNLLMEHKPDEVKEYLNLIVGANPEYGAQLRAAVLQTKPTLLE